MRFGSFSIVEIHETSTTINDYSIIISCDNERCNIHCNYISNLLIRERQEIYLEVDETWDAYRK